LKRFIIFDIKNGDKTKLEYPIQLSCLIAGTDSPRCNQ